MKDLQPHPFAELMPPMSAEDFSALKTDIETNGQQDDVVLYQGKILDGRNRYEAMKALKIKPRFTAFKGTDAEAVAFVRSRHTRRNLTTSQRLWAACKFYPHYQAEADARRSANGGDRKSQLAKLPSAIDCQKDATTGTARDAAGAAFGISGRTVGDGLKLMGDRPDLFPMLATGEKTLAQLKQMAHVSARGKILKEVRPLAIDDDSCKLVLGDAVERLAELKKQSVKVICTDPPYNLGKEYDADPTGDAMKYADFVAWLALWIGECVRVLTPDGSIFVMMNGRYSPGLSVVMRAAGLHYRNTIYWWENNPENQQGNFSDGVRQIHYFTRSETDFIFNADVRIPSRRNEIGDKRGIDTGKLPDNVWIEGRIPGNSGERVPFDKAPPQLPLSIPATCIRVASDPGDLVLDPFNGNGTTAIAALTHGRKYIGIERSPKYLSQSRKWIAAQLAIHANTAGDSRQKDER